MRLYRPHIPWSVRELVVLLQLRAAGINVDEKPHVTIRYHGSAETRVRAYLRLLFGDAKVELHHRPALVNRHHVFRDGVVRRYIPDANDPDHLVYLLAGAGEDHDVETRVRGQHGQYSDLGLARKRKRKERKETARLLRSGPWGKLSGGKFKRPKRRFRSRGFERRPPQRSASRPIER